jgi:Protein of unknown function (DUF2637)
MPTQDKFIRDCMNIAVLMVVAVSFEISFNDIRSLVMSFGGESNFLSTIFPLCVDGMIAASNLTLLFASRYGVKPPRLARFTLWAGICTTLAANIMHGLAFSIGAGIVGAWPAIALTLSMELLIWVVNAGRSLNERTVITFEKSPENNELDAVLNTIANDRNISGRQIAEKTGIPYPRALTLAKRARAMLA